MKAVIDSGQGGYVLGGANHKHSLEGMKIRCGKFFSTVHGGRCNACGEYVDVVSGGKTE